MARNGRASGADYFSRPVKQLAKTSDSLKQRITGALDGARNFVDDELERRRAAIGGVDNLWLLLVQASYEEFQPHCASHYTLKGKLSHEKLVELLNHLVETFPKYKEVLADKGDDFHGAIFKEKKGFKVEERISTVQLPGKAGKDELEAEVGKLLAKPWDLDEPLWEVELVTNYHDDDGAESALIMKGHHLLADGKGYVLSQRSLTSAAKDQEKEMGNRPGEPKPPAKRPTKPSDIDQHLKALDPIFKNPAIAFFFQLFAVFLIGSIVSSLTFVEHFFYSCLHLASSTYMYATVAWRQQGATAGYAGKRVYEREFSVSKTFPLEEVKLCQRAFSGLPPGSLATRAYGQKTVVADRGLHHITLNDVVCAVMTDVLAEEMANVPLRPGRWGQFVQRLNKLLPPRIGLFIPINIREAGEWDMTNLTTAAITFIEPMRKSTDQTTPNDLYKHVGKAHRELMILKRSWLPRIAWWCWHHSLNQFPILWPFPGFMVDGSLLRKYLGDLIIRGFIRSFAAIVTNIPGPYDKKVTLGDLEVMQCALPPQAGKGTCAIGLISYADGLCISVAADSVPNTRGAAKRLCEGFERRFQFYVDTSKHILEEAGNLTPQ